MDRPRGMKRASPPGQPDPAKIRTRFPPEPNGYLHVGHAKSICINFGLAKEYGGVCHLRFDDTNPEKEDTEYVNSIIDAVKWLGFDWAQLGQTAGSAAPYQASDYFDFMYRAAEALIETGHAYVDEQSAEDMRANRGDFGACMSPHTAWLILQGIETLSLRMARHISNTEKVVEFLASQPFVACLPADHALARKRALPLLALQGEPFACISRGVSADYHERIVNLCMDAGFAPEIRYELRHWLSVVSLVSQGLGVALVPQSLRQSALPGAAFVALAGSSLPYDTYCLWKAARDHQALASFVEAESGINPYIWCLVGGAIGWLATKMAGGGRALLIENVLVGIFGARCDTASAQPLSAVPMAPSQVVSKMPAGPMAVIASTIAPVWSNTGAAMALTPSITSPSERLMPCARTSCNWRSKSAHEGSGCTGGMPAGG
eukprot:gene39168-48377_t